MGGILGGGASSGGGTTVQQVNTSAPPAYLQPYLSNAASAAQGAYNTYLQGGLNQPFTGTGTQPNASSPQIPNLVAQATPSDIQAQGTLSNVANTLLPTLQGQTAGASNNLQTAVNNGTYLAPSTSFQYTPTTDQALSSSIAAQLAPLQRQLQQQILPQANSQAIQEGAYGGTQNATVNARAMQNFDTEAANATAQAVYSNEALNASLGEQQGASQRTAATAGNQENIAAESLIPSLSTTQEQQALDQGNIQSQVGALQRGFTQQDIQAAEGLYSGQQAAPSAGINTLISQLLGTNVGGSSMTGTAGAPLAANILAGGLGIAGGAAGLSSLYKLFGGGGSAAGAASGATDATDAASAADPAGIQGILDSLTAFAAA